MFLFVSPFRFSFALVAGLTLLPGWASAEDARPDVPASSGQQLPHYVVLISESKYDEAAGELERILSEPRPPLEAFHVLGQVRLALGQPCAAIEAFERYLSRGGEAVPPASQARVRSHIRQLRQTGVSEASCAEPKSTARIALRCELPGVRATLDDAPVSSFTQEPHEVAPGRHEIVFGTADRAWTPMIVELSSGASTVVHCVEPLSFPQPASARRFDGIQTAGLVLTGAGVATGIASLSMLLYRLGRASAAKELADDPGAPAVGDSVDSSQWINGGLAIAAGVLTATGVTLFVVGSNRKKKREQALGTRDATLSLQLGAQAAQLSWSGSW